MLDDDADSKFQASTLCHTHSGHRSNDRSRVHATTDGTPHRGPTNNHPSPKPQDTEVWEPVPKIVTPGATNSAPPSDAIVLFDGKDLSEWVSAQDGITRQMDRRRRRNDSPQSPRRRQHPDQTHLQKLSAPHRVEDPREHHRHRPGTRQQRRLPRLHRPRRRRIRAAGPRLLQQQDLRQRPGRKHLQTGHPARQTQTASPASGRPTTSSGPRPPSTPTAH